QIPAAFSEVELFLAFDLGMDPQSECRGGFLCQCYRLIGRVKAGNLPTLLREPNRVAPLSHPHIQCCAGLAVLDDFHQEFVRFCVERRILAGENAIPSLRLGAGPLLLDEADLVFGIRIGETALVKEDAIESEQVWSALISGKLRGPEAKALICPLGGRKGRDTLLDVIDCLLWQGKCETTEETETKQGPNSLATEAKTHCSSS